MITSGHSLESLSHFLEEALRRYRPSVSDAWQASLEHSRLDEGGEPTAISTPDHPDYSQHSPELEYERDSHRILHHSILIFNIRCSR